jgi:hypothetical protein
VQYVLAVQIPHALGDLGTEPCFLYPSQLAPLSAWHVVAQRAFATELEHGKHLHLNVIEMDCDTEDADDVRVSQGELVVGTQVQKVTYGSW